MARIRIVIPNATLAKLSQRMRDKARDLRPATMRLGEWVAREARRRAPRGDSRRGSSLASSLNHIEPAHNATVLASDRAYARVQAEGTGYLPGGAITPGRGPLKSKWLILPLNEDAKAMLNRMGASQSLRTQDLTIIRTKSGKLFLARVERVKKYRGSKGSVGPSLLGTATKLLFMLIPRARLKPNPAPSGYAPRFAEAAVRERASVEVWRHLTGRAT